MAIRRKAITLYTSGRRLSPVMSGLVRGIHVLKHKDLTSVYGVD